MTYLSQLSLITAILRELDAQEPGCVVTQLQMNTIIEAVDRIKLAMMRRSPEMSIPDDRA